MGQKMEKRRACDSRAHGRYWPVAVLGLAMGALSLPTWLSAAEPGVLDQVHNLDHASHHLLCFGVVLLTVATAWTLWLRYGAKKPMLAADDFQLLSHAAGDIAFACRLDSMHFEWSQDVGFELLGYDPGELKVSWEHFGDHVHEDDRARLKASWADLLTNRFMSEEFRLRCKDGRFLWVQCYAVPAVRGKKSARKAVGVIRQTQALHEAEEALVQMERTQTVGTMAGGIAHEFNNHMTPIRGYLELALDELGDGHPMHEGLATALDRVEHCADLVQQVQAYGRQSILMPRPESLPRLLPTLVRLAMATNRDVADQVVLEEHFPENLPDAWIDRANLQNVLIELVRNAFDAMPEGGCLGVAADVIEVSRRKAAMHSVAEGTYIRISLSDTGMGIAPEHLAYIFDPFYTTRGRTRSRGMGLSMVQGMMAQHDGFIEVHTVVGKGTTMQLCLPVKQDATLRGDTVLQQPGDEDALPVMPAASPGSLLVADDEEAIRVLVGRIFHKEGWAVSGASDATEVHDAFVNKGARPDLLILDLSMPGPVPEETLDMVQECSPDTQILLISGFQVDERITKLMLRDGVHYLAKPFSPKEALVKIDEILTEPEPGIQPMPEAVLA